MANWLSEMETFRRYLQSMTKKNTKNTRVVSHILYRYLSYILQQTPSTSQPSVPGALNDSSVSPPNLEVQDLVYADNGFQLAMSEKITDR